ncbi:hypothetical protein CARUB_v10002001mg [Capsella rubella]|uniref:EF-hand domain-containing protein n=2 Tax=Capsella rubella TaxID=81985 RepID=R0GXG5_9BRAS|nr:hypothetical protein CARUB_v10002001mg [Capsella rubella]
MMKLIKFNPKRFFSSKKPSKVSRSGTSSLGSASSSSSGETKNLCVTTSSPYYSHLELLKAFTLIDKDNDGAVSRHDLEALLTQLGPNPPNKDEINVMLREVDRDGHGTISIDTLATRVVSSVSSDSSHGSSTELKETFELFDSDRNGLISAEELLRVFAAAIGDDRCTLEECSRMIAAVDEDGDGFVSFNEFSRMMDLY